MNSAKIEREGAFRFQVHGAMTFEHAKSLLQQSAALFASLPELEVDLSRVERADSAGLALMLEWMAQVAERDARVVYTGVPEAILSIARLCQVESLLDGVIVQTSSS